MNACKKQDYNNLKLQGKLKKFKSKNKGKWKLRNKRSWTRKRWRGKSKNI